MAGFAGHATQQVKQLARQRVNIRTGQYLGSIHSTIREGATGPEMTVTADAGHAIYLEEGTRSHVIRPRNARVLRFNVGPQVVYTAHVNHPGTPPFHILRDGIEQAGQRFF